jgi:hypothetical protein
MGAAGEIVWTGCDSFLERVVGELGKENRGEIWTFRNDEDQSFEAELIGFRGLWAVKERSIGLQRMRTRFADQGRRDIIDNE